MLYIIGYDISDDKRRGALASLLLDYGDRVQYSLFEADLEEKELKELREAAEKIIFAEDSLRIYPLCAGCKGKVMHEGPERGLGKGEPWVI
jgi:CRISPR-associated protein Cas2